LLFGIALLALEAHTPAHGAFAAVGTLAVLLGGILLFRVHNLPSRNHSLRLRGDNSPYGTTSFWLIFAIAASLGVISVYVISRVWAARRLPARGPGTTLVGETAIVLTALDPHGQVLGQGERWQAAMTRGSAEPGEHVQVIAQHRLELEVARE